MPPEDKKIEYLEQRIEELERQLSILIRSDRYTFQKDIQMQDGRKIITGKSNGLTICSATDQKVGFFGVTPVVQQADIGTLTETGSDQDSAARATINEVIAVLDAFGFIAT